MSQKCQQATLHANADMKVLAGLMEQCCDHDQSDAGASSYRGAFSNTRLLEKQTDTGSLWQRHIQA
jgi:hypothetical protein